MSTSKPTLVLIHGGWHTPSSYTLLSSALRSAGYDMHIPRLTSVNGDTPPTADLATDTQQIRSYVTSLINAGHRVAVLMHSYGGQVGTNALYGLNLALPAQEKNQEEEQQERVHKGSLTHLIYMTAHALPEQTSMIDKVREHQQEHLIPLAFDFAPDNTVRCRDPRILILDAETQKIPEGTSEDDVKAYLDTLVLWNGHTMYQPIEHCAWRDKEIRVSYIYTTRDMTVPYEYQKSMVERMRKEGKEVETVEIETGHCPNLTAVEKVVEFVKKVAV